MPLSFTDTFKQVPLVRTLTLDSGQYPVDYIQSHQTEINQCIDTYGGILIRNCPLQDESELEAIIEKLIWHCVDYIGGVSPRSNRKKHVYNSTYLVSDMTIPQHREMSYLPEYPDRVSFYCHTPAETGGQTPITDFAQVYSDLEQLQPEFMQRLIKSGVFMNKVYFDSDYLKKQFGLKYYWGWRECFHCSSTAELDEIAQQLNVKFEHFTGYSTMLVTLPVATLRSAHEKPVFFPNLYLNRRTLNLYFELKEALAFMQDQLYTLTREQDNDVYCGDGTLIPIDFINDFHHSVLRNSYSFDWKANDLLLLDNNWLGHGRSSYTGKNRTLWACLSNLKNSD
ncbi:MAG: TauD/TfdA family dioxygenase [Coxiellaceae bacterium]|nr:TauD/TfdA family dioxygenase [Coxiellaceae bacterium]